MAIFKLAQFWVGIGVALAIAGAFFVVYQRGVHNGKVACEGRHAVALAASIAQSRTMERLAQDVADKVGARTARAIGDIKIQHNTETRIIKNDVEKVPVYSQCLLTDGVFDALNRLRAATRTGAVAGPATGLPRPAGSAGPADGHPDRQ